MKILFFLLLFLYSCADKTSQGNGQISIFFSKESASAITKSSGTSSTINWAAINATAPGIDRVVKLFDYSDSGNGNTIVSVNNITFSMTSATNITLKACIMQTSSVSNNSEYHNHGRLYCGTSAPFELKSEENKTVEININTNEYDDVSMGRTVAKVFQDDGANLALNQQIKYYIISKDFMLPDRYTIDGNGIWTSYMLMDLPFNVDLYVGNSVVIANSKLTNVPTITSNAGFNYYSIGAPKTYVGYLGKTLPANWQSLDDDGDGITNLAAILNKKSPFNYGAIIFDRLRAWTHPASLSDNISLDEDASLPAVAMDKNGNAIITWYQSDGVTEQIFKSEYRNGSWTHPTSLSDNISPDGQDADLPAVAMDNNGNAIITWHQSNGSNNQIFKSEYRNGSWTHPTSLSDNISTDGQDAYSPVVAMDNNGNAIISWRQSDGSKLQIFKSEYRNGSWTHPTSLSNNISPDGQDASSQKVAIDDNGNAIITWVQLDGSKWQIFKSEYRNGSWTHPTSLSDNISLDGQNTDWPVVAMDNNGNAIITWRQLDGSKYQIFKSEYRNGSWTHPASLSDNISPDGQDVLTPIVAIDNNGNAIITWRQSDGSKQQIFKSEYRNGSWTHPASLSDNISPDGQDAITPIVAMDNNGNAIITWRQSDGSNSQIFKSEYRNGSWTHPASVSDNISPDGQDAITPMVAMDNNGNAIITWRQSDGSKNQIFKSEYR
ncbi:MAG: hypothetical protein HQK49_10105 [Oligoflexia bacterium]|nr:hypothetical protein [Oligoflexia bacterium]